VAGNRVVVRRAEPDDWATQKVLRLAALADAPDAFIVTLSEARAYPDSLWQQRIVDNPHLHVLVDGRPVGMAVLLDRAGHGELVGVWVDPAARGTGAVDALVAAAIELATSSGQPRINLWVVEGNDRAERAYARNGFVRTGATQPVPGRPSAIECEMSRPLSS
jgi:RimJ/RimL family protein N-acetyltransferase